MNIKSTIVGSIVFCFASFCSGILASNLHNFEEAADLLQRFYYNTKQVQQVLNSVAIEKCRKVLSENNYLAIQCLVKQVKDPYTKFLSPPEAKKELKRIKTITTGVGLVLDLIHPEKIVMVQMHSPAALAGLQAGDEITSINEVPLEYLSDDEINQYLQNGSVGQKVNLDLKRKYSFFSVALLMKELPSISVRSKLLQNGKIALIKIDDLLSENAVKDLKKVLADKKYIATSGLILDLRGNKGGLLSNAINLADEFLDSGQIVRIKSHQGTKEIFAKPSVAYSKPIIILLDSKTASASEVIAAALKDNNRAILVGTRSYGKGLIQQIKPLSDGSALHITVDKFYGPKGEEINKVGIQPNIYIKEPEQQLVKALAQFRKFPGK